MILKEMHYTMDVIPDEDYKLVEGEYKGHKYLAVNNGFHPCCYVSIPNDKAIDDDDISCHGGITWHKDHLPGENPDDKNHWIGWDYGHVFSNAGKLKVDYTSPYRNPHSDEKLWCSAELERDCLAVIDQLEQEQSKSDFFSIYFNDLNDDAKERLLKAVGASSASEMNWDIDMCPLAMYPIPIDEGL